VSGVLALSTDKPLVHTWRQVIAASLKYDLMSMPVIYGFAMIYNRLAIAGVLFLAVLLLGARQLYRTNRQLESTNQELLEVIVAAIEMRDPYTSGHSQRVAHYSSIIARAIGLPSREVVRIGVAALLHDVGKIDQQFAEILQKPGRLTDDERRVIELHPIKSEELVSMVSSLVDILPAVRHHHERWDGKGYPDRIQGLAIPLGSRIITFADTIDAMTTDRPYRPALGPDEVRLEIQRNRGSQFDPDLCDKLLVSPLFLEIFATLPHRGDERRLEEPHIAA
jgi:HD-GYP domain-containing protein (c-di-GMP phosphodiesterase class II)